MTFNVFRIVRSEGPKFTTEVLFVKFAQIEASNSELVLALANLRWPERRYHIAVEPAYADKR